MAWLFKQKKSPFWWLGYKAGGKVVRKATPFRHSLLADTRRAKELRAKHELEELKSGVVATHLPHKWSAWVTAFLASRYAHSPRTITRVLGIWRTLSHYLDEIKVTCPEQITREHCLRYVDWRKRAGHMNAHLANGQRVSHNTVILELRILSIVLNEAVQRGMIQSSPCWRLGLRKEPARKAGELTPEIHALIRAEIRRRLRAALRSRQPDEIALANFYRRSWQIAGFQGWRLAETHLHLNAFDLHHGTVQRHVKGRRTVKSEVNPATAELVRRLIRLGQTETYVRPGNPSLRWFKFFESLRHAHPELKLVSHRSLRVTFISRLLRAGVPTDTVASLVGHRSILTTQAYRRITHGEVTQAWTALAAPPAGKPPVP